MKVAFVIPWYGPDIPGGAESLTRRTVEHLCQVGVPVEVLTTCVREFLADWGRNYHRPGVTEVNGVTVHRFPVRKRDRAAFDAVNWKLVHDQPVSMAEEQVFVRESVRSPALTEYIAKHLNQYVFVFIPYMFGTTYWGIAACEGKALLVPCLHDESYARMDVFQQMFAQVRQVIFNSPAELDLAHALYRLGDDVPMLLGGGVDTDFSADGDAFRQKYGVTRPFILYAGRKDKGKNVGLLIDYFRRYRAHRTRAVDLVLIGGGALSRGLIPDEGIWDLGFVPVQDKYNAYAAATVLCQPSLKESFSLVLMEAWVTGTPTLVHANCAVTTDHCVRSNGGLYFGDYLEFEACLELMLSQPELRKALGANGRRYVLGNYRWDIIVERYSALVEDVVNIPLVVGEGG